MRLDRSLPGVMTSGSGMDTPPTDFLPSRVATVAKEILRAFPHTKRVGNYLLGRTLGEGSFAKVKEAMHTLTGEKVAIKVIDKKKAKADAYVRKNLRREGKLLQTVRHNNVISLLEIMETENSYYLVTELCQGGDLMDLICAQKRLDESQARRYTRQIISAIDYLHKAGILHRDLKVENLLLDHNKDIKIIDFGLSNSVRVSHTKEGGSQAQEYCVTQCGSPAYAAPELLGNKKYGPKVDIWSIGVNMYAMLTGNLPFTVEPFNIKALHNKMLNADMNPIPEHLSEDCRNLLRKLLTPAPEERISLREAMRHPWITDGNNRPMTAAPFPNKLSSDDLDHDIVKHMSSNMEYRMSEVIRLATKNIPNNATATYHLLLRKLIRYKATVLKSQSDVTGSRGTTPSSSKQTIRRSQAHTGVINLNPINKSQQSRDRAQQARDRARQAAIGRDSPANRRKTESGATSADNRKSDAKSARRSDTSSATSEGEKTLVRRRIAHARVLVRMQGEDAGSDNKRNIEEEQDGESDDDDDDSDERQDEVIRRFTDDLDLENMTSRDKPVTTLPRIKTRPRNAAGGSQDTNTDTSTSTSSSSGEGPKSMCSNPTNTSSSPKKQQSSRGSSSDPMTRTDGKKTSTSGAATSRTTAKRVVLDIGSYDKYVRGGAGKDSKKSLPSVSPPRSFTHSPSRTSQGGGAANRRVVNIYPNFNSRSPNRQSHPARAGRASLTRSSLDNSLNVLGEKAAVSGGRSVGMGRSSLDSTQRNAAKSDSSKGEHKITLPTITPPLSGRTQSQHAST